MKYLLLILLMFLMSLSIVANEQINIWSGREVVLPGNGVWQLKSEHGRVLLSGNGEINLNLPALNAGTTLDADLMLNGESQKIKIWSPQILENLEAIIDFDDDITRKLKSYGLVFNGKKTPNIVFVRALPLEFKDEEIVLVFTSKWDFPLNIGSTWNEVSLKITKNLGLLGMIIDKREQIIDTNGNGSYLRLQKGKSYVYIFSPDFDFDNVDNIILIKTIMEINKIKS